MQEEHIFVRVIAIANQKGGCGKTTTSINLAACLAHLQKRVLLVDLDPQGHSSCGLGIRAERLAYTLYDLLGQNFQEAKPPIREVLHEINPYFLLLPSYSVLAALEEELVNQADREKRLKNELERVSQELRDIDYAILDCPPNLGILTFNALEAADEVIIPIEPSFFSLHGLAKISETLHLVKCRRDRSLDIHALLTLFDSRTCFAREIYEEVKTHFRGKLFKTIIHESVVLKEAAASGKSVVQHDLQSQAYRDYFNLAVEYLEREWSRALPEQGLGWNHLLATRYGPRRVMGGVLFQFASKNARTVEIAGDFNGWIPEPLVYRPDQELWQKIIPVEKGNFRYKYIIDGEWQMDPDYPVKRENVFGSFDSYLELV